MSSVVEILQRNFSERWNQPLLIDAVTGRTYTYSQFAGLSAQWGQRLKARGAGPQTRVAILLNNSPEFAALYLACLFNGFVAVPINPNLHAREIDAILKRSGATCLVVSPVTRKALGATLSVFPEKSVLCMAAERDGAANGESDVVRLTPPEESSRCAIDFANVKAENLLSITFTSGTTSLPKGICHTVRSLLSSAHAFNQALGLGADNRMYHVLPMSYMAGFLNTLLCPIMAGGSLVLNRPFDAQMALQFWPMAVKHNADTLWLVPTILTSLLMLDRSKESPEWCRRNIRVACVGTAPLPLRLRLDFEARYGITLLESYGLSETLFVTSNTPAGLSPQGSAGRVLPGVTLKIHGDNNEVLPPGSDGEIAIQSPFLHAGYLNYDTQMPELEPPNAWFRSGDVGHLNESGDLFITNRKKDLVIRGGVNISPRAIEEVLQTHAAVETVAVIGLPHQFYGEQIVAVLRLKPGFELEAEKKSLAALCKEQLNSASQPDRYIATDTFPTTTTGKIQKNKLRKQYAGAKP